MSTEKLQKIIAKVEKTKVGPKYIKSERFQKYLHKFVKLRGNDNKLFIRLVSGVVDSNHPEVFRLMFNDDYWRYLDFFSFNQSSWNADKNIEFPSQIDELEYYTKSQLIEVYSENSDNIDVNLPISKILLELTKTRGYSHERIMDLYLEEMFGMSVSFIEFTRDYLLEYPKEKRKVRYNLENFGLDISGLNLNDVIKMLKTMTYTDIMCCQGDAFLYYRMMNQNKFIAIQSFLLNLNEVCELDDSDEITLSKSSVKALLSSEGVKAWVA